MRRLTKVALSLGLSGVGTVAALYASGFPARIGLTKTESRLSLPGDLLFPVAPVQGDRVVRVSATPAEIWPQLLELEQAYSDLWDRPLELIYEERNALMVWRTGSGNDAPWDATLSVSLLDASDNKTVVHLRERYVSGDSKLVFTSLFLRLSTGAIYPQVRRLVQPASKSK